MTLLKSIFGKNDFSFIGEIKTDQRVIKINYDDLSPFQQHMLNASKDSEGGIPVMFIDSLHEIYVRMGEKVEKTRLAYGSGTNEEAEALLKETNSNF